MIVRANGVYRITVTSLSGVMMGNQRFLRAGIDHYDNGTTNETVVARHGAVALSQTDWLGP